MCTPEEFSKAKEPIMKEAFDRWEKHMERQYEANKRYCIFILLEFAAIVVIVLMAYLSGNLNG